VQLAKHDSFNADSANWDISDNSMTHKDTQAHINAIDKVFEEAAEATFTCNWSCD